LSKSRHSISVLSLVSASFVISICGISTISTCYLSFFLVAIFLFFSLLIIEESLINYTFYIMIIESMTCPHIDVYKHSCCSTNQECETKADYMAGHASEQPKKAVGEITIRSLRKKS
jgi:hypothetical protein